MKIKTNYFNCGNQLKKVFMNEILEIESIISLIQWSEEYRYTYNGVVCVHQTAYNKAFEDSFIKLGWESQPILHEEPKLIGDFRKGLIFVEIQFGNSSALYRDYYKFQYGLSNGLLSLAVLIVPINPKEFFPTRPKSVQNMADYELAYTCFSILPINVPTLLIGLMPKN
jgi:hypothetical protein